MENSHNGITLHPNLLEVLFAFKKNVSSVFREVLGLYEIDHVAFAHVDQYNQLLALSSTPALEFNLFNSTLWRYDKSYCPQWFRLCSQDYWQNLYCQSRYDELYYLKQIKPAYPSGLTLATKIDNGHLIYSLASKKSFLSTYELFATQHENFYKIGQYCSNMLLPLLDNHAHLINPSIKEAYEMPK